MVKIPKSTGASAPERITGPIPLLAYLGGFCEALVMGLAYVTKGDPVFPYIVLAGIALPFVLILIIYRLISAHYAKLYRPQDFRNENDFLEIVKLSTQSIRRFSSIFRPFGGDEKIDFRQRSGIREQVTRIETVLGETSSSDFLALHSWFNSEQRHDLALVCIDVAIAKGENSPRNFSFRSASLRKLNRLPEALSSTEMALTLKPSDSDALYNLARIHMQTGDIEKANQILDRLRQSGEKLYVERLFSKLSQLNSAKT
jgi:tetratricopeptide (TPR) repeat protein